MALKYHNGKLYQSTGYIFISTPYMPRRGADLYFNQYYASTEPFGKSMIRDIWEKEKRN